MLREDRPLPPVDGPDRDGGIRDGRLGCEARARRKATCTPYPERWGEFQWVRADWPERRPRGSAAGSLRGCREPASGERFQGYRPHTDIAVRRTVAPFVG